MATTAIAATTSISSVVVLRPPVLVDPDAVTYIVAVELWTTPFKVAVTVSITVSAELPAVNVAVGTVLLEDEIVPSELLRDHA
jgi:hypothetical protein